VRQNDNEAEADRGVRLNKLVAAFMLLFLLGSILSGIAEGGGGMAATRLTADVSATATTLNVSSTEGFLKSDYVRIGNEKIKYVNKTDTTFIVHATEGRGYDGTEAASYNSGDRVYSSEAEVLNSALGFNVASTGSSVGAISIPIAATNFVFITMPRIVMWQYSWLQTGWLVYMRTVLQFMSVGFIVYMSYMIASALGGVMQGIFRRG